MLYILQEVSMHYNLGKHKKNAAIHLAIKFQSLQQYTYNCSDTFQSLQQYTYNCSDKFQSLCSNLNHEYFSVDLIFFKNVRMFQQV